MPAQTPYLKISAPPKEDRNRWDLARARVDSDGVRRYYCQETQEYWDDPNQPDSGPRETPREISAFDLVNRFKFHPATPETGPKHEMVRQVCLEAAEELQKLVPPGRELSLAITSLEKTMMWSNAGIARRSES